MEINWDEIDMEKVGNKLATIRESKNQTQNQFIEGCNMDYRRYSKYETGLHKPRNNEENFFKLLSKHNIDSGWLLYDDNIQIVKKNQKNDNETSETNFSLYLKIKRKNGIEVMNIKNKPLKYLEKVRKYLELTTE
jgi:transcriptional regulator with XRE-family HTH domain